MSGAELAVFLDVAAVVIVTPAVVARLGDILRRSRVRRALDAVTGTVLVAFGVRLATER